MSKTIGAKDTKPRKRRVELPDGDIIVKYKNGLSAAEIGRQYNVSATTIKNLLIKYEVFEPNRAYSTKGRWKKKIE